MPVSGGGCGGSHPAAYQRETGAPVRRAAHPPARRNRRHADSNQRAGAFSFSARVGNTARAFRRGDSRAVAAALFFDVE